MDRLLHYLPHAITALALAAAAALLIHHSTQLDAYHRMTEASRASRTWTDQLREFAYEAATNHDRELPCPALAQRHSDGIYDTYTMTATISRAYPPPPDESKPVATCDDTPYYLIETAVGWADNPIAVQHGFAIDIQAATENPELLMRPFVRQEPEPFTITALKDLP